MKALDRAALVCAAFFSLYFFYHAHVESGYIAAVLALVSSAGLCAVGMRLGRKRAQNRRQQRVLSVRAQAQMLSLALLPTDEAAHAINTLLQAEFSPGEARFFPEGILYAEKKVWVSLYLRHPQAGAPEAQAFADAIRQKKRARAAHCVLVCLGRAGNAPADPALAIVPVLDAERLCALYARHADLLPETQAPPRPSRWRAFLRVLKAVPERRRIPYHIAYALLLVPGWRLSHSPILLACILFHLGMALRGLLAHKAVLQRSPFEEI